MDLGLTYTVADDGSKVMSMPAERREWVISFVRENAKTSPAAIEALLHEGHAELFAALEGVSEAQAAYKPAPDDWSILEVIAHEVTVKDSLGRLMTVMATGSLPPGIGPQFEEAKAQDGLIITRFDTLAEARAAAQAAHDRAVAFVRGIGDHTNTEVTFRHFYFGAFNAREWPVFLRVHDGDHTPHIGKIKATPGYPPA